MTALGSIASPQCDVYLSHLSLQFRSLHVILLLVEFDQPIARSRIVKRFDINLSIVHLLQQPPAA